MYALFCILKFFFLVWLGFQLLTTAMFSLITKDWIVTVLAVIGAAVCFRYCL